jgi:hypothetical protein
MNGRVGISIYNQPSQPNNVVAQAQKQQAMGSASGGQSSPMLHSNMQSMGQAFGQLPFGGIIRLDKYRKIVEGQDSWL